MPASHPVVSVSLPERLFEKSPDMLGPASLDGVFTHLNPAWERTLGWTADQLMAEPFISFVHPDDVAETLEQYEELATVIGTEVVSFENRYRTRSGEFPAQSERRRAEQLHERADAMEARARDAARRAAEAWSRAHAALSRADASGG